MKHNRLYALVAMVSLLPACSYIDGEKAEKKTPEPEAIEAPKQAEPKAEDQNAILQVRNGDQDNVNTNVGLLYDFVSNSICTGTMLSSTIVLTAGHCVRRVFLDQGTSALVKFTNVDQITQADLDGQFAGKPHAAHIRTRHTIENMNGEQRSRDVALIKLAFPITNYNAAGVRLNDIVGPVPPMQVGEIHTVSGYGLNINSSGGNAWYGRRFSGSIVYQGESAPNLYAFSAYAPKNQIACQGDSGAPLIRNGFIYGVLSAGTIGSCGTATANHYAAIGKNAEWIYKTMREFNHPCQPLAGDANLDNVVDGSDFMIIQRGIGMQDATFVDGDFTADGIVDATDVNKWKQYYGQTQTCS